MELFRIGTLTLPVFIQGLNRIVQLCEAFLWASLLDFLKFVFETQLSFILVCIFFVAFTVLVVKICT